MTIGGGGAGGTTAEVKQEIWLKCLIGSGCGQTLTSGQYGIKKVSGTWTQLTTWQDVYATTILTDGLGRGTMWINGIQQFTADATLYVAGATYTLNQKISFNDVGYKCSKAGVSPTFGSTGENDAQFIADSTIPLKPKQVFILNNSSGQFPYALCEGDWVRAFAGDLLFGTSVNPATNTSTKQTAYTPGFF